MSQKHKDGYGTSTVPRGCRVVGGISGYTRPSDQRLVSCVKLTIFILFSLLTKNEALIPWKVLNWKVFKRTRFDVRDRNLHKKKTESSSTVRSNIHIILRFAWTQSRAFLRSFVVIDLTYCLFLFSESRLSSRNVSTFSLLNKGGRWAFRRWESVTKGPSPLKN